MKVVINALAYKQQSSGIGVLLRELYGTYVKTSIRPCQVILPKDGPEFPEGAGTQLLRAPWKHGQSLGRLWFQSFQMGRSFCKDAVLLTTDSKTPFFLPRSCRLLPLVTDLAVYRMPEAYQRSRVWWWKLQYRYVKRRASRFLAISEFTKRDLAELFGIPEERIEVVPCACSPDFRRVEDTRAVRERYGLKRPFLLFVGNSNPRKNLERMLRAFDLAKERGGIPHQLVIAGEQGWKFDREKALAGLRSRADVRFIGFVPDGDMPALYSAAEAFVFPTLYEGFGIPVLEAQACGVPVLTSRVSSLPEVGGGGALYVDPCDEDAICQGMLRLLTDHALAERLVQAGYENGKRFSWERSARRLSEIIEKEVGHGLDGEL